MGVKYIYDDILLNEFNIINNDLIFNPLFNMSWRVLDYDATSLQMICVINEDVSLDFEAMVLSVSGQTYTSKEIINA